MLDSNSENMDRAVRVRVRVRVRVQVRCEMNTVSRMKGYISVRVKVRVLGQGDTVLGSGG